MRAEIAANDQPDRRSAPVRYVSALAGLLDWLASAGAILAAIATALLVIGTTSEVTYRAINHRSISGLLETSELIIVFAAFLGNASAQRAGLHVSTGIVTDWLPPRLAETVRLIGLFAVLLLLMALTWTSFTAAIESVRSNEYRFGLIPIPLWPGRIAVVAGYGLLLLEVLRQLVCRGAALWRGPVARPRHEVEEEDVGWV